MLTFISLDTFYLDETNGTQLRLLKIFKYVLLLVIKTLMIKLF